MTTPARRPKFQPFTILFTDIEGSTSLTQRLGDDGAQEVLRIHNAIVRAALRRCRGTEVKHTGDGIMASFASATTGLVAAISIQKTLAEFNAGRQPRLKVRIGLNSGEPIQENEDFFGTAVQLAKRVCDAAGAERILVSNVVRELVSDRGFLFAAHESVSPTVSRVVTCKASSRLEVHGTPTYDDI